MAQFEFWMTTDLKRGSSQVQVLHGQTFTQDNLGNRVGVVVMDGGEPATLDGTVTGYVIRADGGTVVVVGAMDGNKAYIDLPESAYAVPGQIQIAIRLVSGEAKTVLGALTAYVQRTATGTIIDPGEVIPSLDELLAKLDDMDDAIAAAEQATSDAQDATDELNNGMDSIIKTQAAQPTEPLNKVWVDTSTNVLKTLPEVKDNEVSAVDTWSSQKINHEISIFAQDTPWVKELYFIDDTLSGCLLNNVARNNGTYRIRFANAAGDTFVADTGVLTESDEPYGIVPIYNRGTPQVILGYGIFDWPAETVAPKKPVLARAFDLAFSPAIAAHIENANAKTMNIACIGDSLTAGVITGESSTEKGYPYWFAKAVGCKNVKNYGIPGASCYSWFNEIGNLITFSNEELVLDGTIDAAVIMFGTNGGVGVHVEDDTSFLPEAPYLPNTMASWRETYPTYASYPSGTHCQAAYLCRIIEYIYEHCGPDTKIILCTPPYNDMTNSNAKTVINSEQTIRKIAGMYRIPVIDVLNGFGPNFITTRDLHSSDYLHFTEDGYKQLGSFIGNQFNAVVGAPLKQS